jgi:hypothetical protein
MEMNMLSKAEGICRNNVDAPIVIQDPAFSFLSRPWRLQGLPLTYSRAPGGNPTAGLPHGIIMLCSLDNLQRIPKALNDTRQWTLRSMGAF